MARVLVVEDDDDIREVVAIALAREGHDVGEAGDAATARALLAAGDVDLLILDLTLPDADGLDLLAEVKDRSDLPTIILSAHSSEGDRVLGLRAGADDYVVKPFSPRELSARVEAVLRRERRAATGADLHYDDLHIDRLARRATVAGRPVDLTAKEFDVLSFLATHPGEVVDREAMSAEVWPDDDTIDPATVTEFVRRVRQRLEVDPRGRRWITTVWGTGYRFDPHPTQTEEGGAGVSRNS